MTAPPVERWDWEVIKDRDSGDLAAFKRLVNVRLGKLGRTIAGMQSSITTALGQTYWINVRLHGALGDGVTNDAPAITTLFAAALPGDVFFFPPGNYLIAGAPTLTGTDHVTVFGYGATLTLSGVNAMGVKLTGMHDQLHIHSLRIVCSGVLADNHQGIGNIPTPGVGTGGRELIIRDVVVEDSVRGIYLDVGVTFDWWDVTIQGCAILRTTGINSGQGYGITVSGVWGAKVLDNYVEYSTRHALYVSAGDKHLVDGNTIYRHRFGIGTNNTVGALEIARCNDVIATNNLMVECTDNAMDVRPDETASRNTRGMLVKGNTFIDSITNDLVIGNQSPSTSGAFEGIVVEGNTFIRSSNATNAGYPIRVMHGVQVHIHDNYFDGDRNYTVFAAPIYLSGADGAAYTEQVTIEDNACQYTATGGGYVAFVELGAVLCTGSATLRIVKNATTLSGGAGNALVVYDAACTTTTLELWGNTTDDSNSTAVGPLFRAHGSMTIRGDAQARTVTARNSSYGFADFLQASDGTNRGTWGLSSAAGGFASKVYAASQGWEYYNAASALVGYLTSAGTMQLAADIDSIGVKAAITSTAVDLALTSAHYMVTVDATGGARTITLPPAASNAKRVYVIKKVDASGNAVTIDPDGAELIDGAANKALAVQWASATIQCDGTAWYVQ